MFGMWRKTDNEVEVRSGFKFRTVMLACIIGQGIGGYGVYQLAAAPMLKMAIAGACAQPGIQFVMVNMVSWYNCTDAVIANHIQVSDIAADQAQALAEVDPIGDIIRKSEKKGKRK